MTEFLTSGDMFPFTVSIALVLGLVLLELIALLLGWSLLSLESDGLDVDADGFELDAEGFELDAEGGELDAEAVEIGAGTASLSAWLGIGQVPLAIWVASLLTAFGLSGFILQTALNGAFGFTLAAPIAAALAAVPALGFTRHLSGFLGHIIPKTETSAVSLRGMGGQHGIITQGTAARGKPAEAKVKDRHGNMHYLRVEPYEDDETLPQGTEVYVIRQRDGTFRAMEITLD